MPLTVHSTCVAPARTPASVFATASPRSSWQWTATVDLGRARGRARRTSRTNAAYSSGSEYPTVSGQVDRRRAGLDRRAADLGDERRVGAGRVLACELDLVDAAVDVGDRLARLLDDLLGLEAELELHVDRARREDDVDARAAARDGECLDGGVEVLAARPRERRDGGSAHGRCDCAHAFEVAGRGDREPRLDHVDPERVERVGDLHLLVGREGDARRLLAVSQGGVENRDPAVPHWLLLRSGPPGGRTSPALRSVCAPRGA